MVNFGDVFSNNGFIVFVYLCAGRCHWNQQGYAVCDVSKWRIKLDSRKHFLLHCDVFHLVFCSNVFFFSSGIAEHCNNFMKPGS